MKRTFLLVLATALLLCGCTSAQPSCSRPITVTGDMPTEFQEIVSQNLFRGVTAFQDRVLLSCRTESGYFIQIRDFHGNLLTEHVQSDKNNIDYLLHCETVTTDGGFLYVLNPNASNNPFRNNGSVSSFVLKYDSQGKLEWETVISNDRYVRLDCCIETESGYYFFGDHSQKHSENTTPSDSRNICIYKISKSGEILQNTSIGGTRSDSLWYSRTLNGNFILYGWIHSTDGDFAGNSYSNIAPDWKITVDSELNILDKSLIDWTYTNNQIIGYQNGKPVSANDLHLAESEDETIFALLEYDDFYLVISEHITGVYENKPSTISSIWYYTETVYRAYDWNGNLLWTASVDSSPESWYTDP